MISVIIVTTNIPKYLEDCINSLQSQHFQDFEIIIVFNNSQDTVINNFRRYFSKINFIINNENLLYCKAYNQGIRQSKGKYILCLNDDVILEDHFVEELVKTIILDERIGMVSGKILQMDKINIDSTGLFLDKSRKPLERGFNQKDNNQYNKEGYIFGVSGAAAFYRKAMLEDIRDGNEYFDENYGIFYEDLDLSWRATLRGWKAYYNPRAVAYHVRGATAKFKNPSLTFLRRYYFPSLSQELQFHFIKNRYMTMVKNDNLKNFLGDFWHILSYDLKLWLYISLFNPKLVLKIIDIIKFLRIAMQKRKIVKRLIEI